MRRVPSARLIAAALVLQLHALPARADEVVLDLDAVVRRAAGTAPAVVSARGQIGEAKATRVGAGLVFTENPEIEVEAGPRFGDDRSTDVAVQLGQRVRLGGTRGARRALAEARVAHAEAAAGVAALGARLDAALAFLDALHAQLMIAETRGAEDLARRAADIARRRRAAGDVTDLEVGLATAAAGRARAATLAAEAERAAAVGRLATLVGLAPEDTVVLRGDLREATALTLDALAPAAARRADLLALAAEARVAEGEGRLARAGGRPELGLWVAYEREEATSVVLGGVSLSLPLWDRGQGGAAEARARAARVAAEHDVTARAASRQVRDAFAAYEHARAAVEAFETDVMPALADSEGLLTRSVDAGTLSIADYLLARQELLAGRKDHLDLLLALARARVTAQLTAGVSP